ncbi:MAG: FAD-binding oxidoreductase [Pseudomonadota bacterium]
MPDAALIERFIDITGRPNVLTVEDDLTHYVEENRFIYVGKTELVLKPNSTEQVSQILTLANETNTPVVPQGGHTGHAGGGVPDESGEQIIVSLERMNKIRDIDTAGNTLTAEAGVILQTIQETADANDRLFPLSIGSQASCQIGGNISSNAGGTGVLAYGNTRELVLGLEAVLPNGEIWNGLRRLKKDNTGYSLKNLFIGAEGTLGVVTAAVLKLFPKPKGQNVVWVALESPNDALSLLNLAQGMAGAALTGFELIHRTPLEYVLRNIPGSRDPMEEPHEWYVLAEISSGRSADDADALTEAIFTEALDRGLAKDAVMAQSGAQRDAFWKLREDMGPAQIPEGGSIKHDISVPVHAIPDFVARASEIVLDEIADARICAFGHMGDGNLHYNVSQPAGGDREAFLEHRQSINDKVHALVVEMDGSISAEHGIGRLKRESMAKVKSQTEMEMMRAVKNAFDPKGIMNPGKVL